MQDKTLMVIDSSHVLMEITKRILERAGYTVYCAVGVADAKEMLAERAPDGIIIDCELPDGDGIDLCRELKKQSDAPIILLSADDADEPAARRAGAYCFLMKPCNYDVLKTSIGMMLNTEQGDTDAADRHGGDSGAATVANATAAGEAIAKAGADGAPPDGSMPQIERQPAYPQKKAKPYVLNLLYRISAACLILVFISVAIYSAANSNTTSRDLPDQPAPLAEFPLPDENAKPRAGNDLFSDGGQGYLIPKYDSVTIAEGDQNVSMTLLNPAGNPYSFTFELILDVTGETLYISGLVSPGMSIEAFTLSRTPAKGEYSAELVIRAYDSDSFVELSKINAPLTLIVV